MEDKFHEEAEKIKDFLVDEISKIDRKRSYSGRSLKQILKDVVRKMEDAKLVSDRRRSMTEKLMKEW